MVLSTLSFFMFSEAAPLKKTHFTKDNQKFKKIPLAKEFKGLEEKISLINN